MCATCPGRPLGAFDGHGICTAEPWVFSSEPVPDATLAADAEHILAAKACSEADSCTGRVLCRLEAPAGRRNGLKDYVWRAAHPTAAGQRASPPRWSAGSRGRV